MFGNIKNWIGSKKQTRCCCFHFGRCGSTLLGDMLDGHPNIEWRGELFHPLIKKPEELDWIKSPFDLLTHPLAKTNSRLFGFETKFQHLGRKGLDLELGEFLQRLAEFGFGKFILLKRNNYLRQAISVARGKLAGQWHYSSEQPNPQFAPLKLDVNSIILSGRNREILECFEFMNQTYEAAQTALEARLPTLQLEYENDLEEDPDSGFQKTIQFLDLPYANSQVTVRKLGGQPIEHMLTNFSEVQDRLAGTQFEWMLDK